MCALWRQRHQRKIVTTSLLPSVYTIKLVVSCKHAIKLTCSAGCCYVYSPARQHFASWHLEAEAKNAFGGGGNDILQDKDSNGQITAGVERCCTCYHRHSKVWSLALQILHWLDVPDRVLFKLAVTAVHQCLNGSAPPYLSEHCFPVSSADTRQYLGSANRHLLAVPRFRLNTYGRRAFSVAGPMAWNSLPDFMRDPTSSTDCFRRLLKTYLFARY